jgi:steroid delta-isomerase-like uncharacterized protein
MATTSELLDRFVELFNADKIEESEKDYAPGAFAEEIGTNRRFTPQEATTNGRNWKQAFPDARGTTKIVDGKKGAAEIVWRGTNRGSLMGQPPTGKTATVRAVVIIETNGDKITRSAHYIDVASLMAQLGIAPSAQPAM